MAKNLSAVKAITPKRDAKQNKFTVVKYVSSTKLKARSFLGFCVKSMTNSATLKGSISKPTPEIRNSQTQEQCFQWSW